ncbi:hypothetical protein AB0O34_34730 [Sphaerisporangium sp. NPDC088356]|uniref:hypothetical protein n=1 Tax=Sphaerisporangium sp. NPDC088356 TaxID=3154871 RepID=UPI00343AFCDC
MLDRLNAAGLPCEQRDTWAKQTRGQALDVVSCRTSTGDTVAWVFADQAGLNAAIETTRTLVTPTGVTDIAGTAWLLTTQPANADLAQQALGGRIVERVAPRQ